ncbi:hypothetical protein ACE1B6_26160 [Aerosakkonemataceae cyanobacterium BLCC-F154]|uniref:Cthe-2314-like HEPN domain-containing protein n=1 Tax=Floridaenema fluviatile BLCC-F154 TaxID=3153640 RepID=A0ABV4YIU7_9CYAN
MKHYCLCINCLEADNTSLIWAVGEVESNLLAICRCPNGHVQISGLQHDLFDVLFTSGIDAYRKGFYSESVMSFAASLERAYELFIKLNLFKTDIPLEIIDKFWKEIEGQSERQYGAFCSAYLMTVGEIWNADQNQVGFRNKVIHKGYIANSKKAKEYAEYIIGCLNKIMKAIKENFAEQKSPLYFHIKNLAKREVEKALKENPGAKYSADSRPSLLKWNNRNHEDATFEDALALAERFAKIIGEQI